MPPYPTSQRRRQRRLSIAGTGYLQDIPCFGTVGRISLGLVELYFRILDQGLEKGLSRVLAGRRHCINLSVIVLFLPVFLPVTCSFLTLRR